MIGVTLAGLRRRIEEFASDGGAYYVVCSRTGERPIPVAGKRFAERETARRAVRATERYRRALRRYDPRVPYYDLIVCQDAVGPAGAERADDRSGGEGFRPCAGAGRSGEPPDPERRHLVEFCHRVAAAVFEGLSDAGYDAVETGVMDAYVGLAETVADPDDLCLRLLESMATELADRLAPADQADVLDRAAARLGPADSRGDPVTATCSRLRAVGVLGGCAPPEWSDDPDDGIRSVVVRLPDYALSPCGGRLPVLPVVLDLSRRRRNRRVAARRAVAVDAGWDVTLVFADDAGPEGPATAPIRFEE